MRMAQRDAHSNALEYVRKKKSNDSNKPPMKKARMDQSSIEAVTAAQLQLDKDDGEASDEDALVIDQLEKPGMEDEGINRRRRKEYTSSSLDIDGDDGILAAALKADSDVKNGTITIEKWRYLLWEYSMITIAEGYSEASI